MWYSAQVTLALGLVVFSLIRGDTAPPSPHSVDGISDFRAVKYEALLHNMDSFTEIGKTRVG